MGLDQCGSSVIQSTMLTFSPGELSSIGPPGLDSFSSEIKPFDFKDLPCPPFDIAVSHQPKCYPINSAKHPSEQASLETRARRAVSSTDCYPFPNTELESFLLKLYHGDVLRS